MLHSSHTLPNYKSKCIQIAFYCIGNVKRWSHRTSVLRSYDHFCICWDRQLLFIRNTPDVAKKRILFIGFISNAALSESAIFSDREYIYWQAHMRLHILFNWSEHSNNSNNNKSEQENKHTAKIHHDRIRLNRTLQLLDHNGCSQNTWNEREREVKTNRNQQATLAFDVRWSVCFRNCITHVRAEAQIEMRHLRTSAHTHKKAPRNKKCSPLHKKKIARKFVLNIFFFFPFSLVFCRFLCIRN